MAEAALETAYIAGKKRAPENLGRVLILGLGKSGRYAARYCARLLGERVSGLCIAAGAQPEDESDAAEEMDSFLAELTLRSFTPIYCEFGDEAVPSLAQKAQGHFDLCIASPGIPYWEQLYQDALAHCTEVISEVEFAWRESAEASKWVAITGTNGKTTVTSCCASILQTAGLKARAVGNIGEVCLKAVSEGTDDIYVAEVSSYQLASTKYFAPDVAVCLNITPDHIHWHKTFEAYRDAKFKLFSNLAAVKGVAVLEATNDVVRAKVRELKQMPADKRGFDYIALGTAQGIQGDMREACGADNAAFIASDGTLHVAFSGTDHVLCNESALQMHGRHNASNALAAAAAAVALGVCDAVVAQALASFAPLEHRIEPCGSVGGVRCFNDSKATNVDATIKALSAFPDAKPIVLLGGDDKGTDLTGLIEAAHEHASGVVCFGAAGNRFAQAFAEAQESAPAGFFVRQAERMEPALDSALEVAKPGDVVLLSPACASFDEFIGFEARGYVFKQAVASRALAERANGGAGNAGAVQA